MDPCIPIPVSRIRATPNPVDGGRFPLRRLDNFLGFVEIDYVAAYRLAHFALWNLMQLVCPNCNARYLAPDDAIGPNGRRVRCAKCAHVWRAEPASAPPPPPETPEAEAPPPPPPPPEPTPDPSVRVEPLPRNRLPAPQDAATKGRSRGGWIFLLLFILALLAALYIGRDTVMRVWPPATKLYEAVGIVEGMAMMEKKPALEVGDLSNEWTEADGKLELVLRGQVTNDGDEAAEAPYVRIRLFDRNGLIVRDKRTLVEGGAIGPGESRAFEIRFDDPGEVARAIPALE